MKLAMEHLSKQFKNKIAVKQIDTILTEGVYGFLGANGAGKTTTLRIISTLIKADSGDVFVDGIGVIPQLPSAVGTIQQIRKDVLFGVLRLWRPSLRFCNQLLYALKSSVR